MSTRHSSIEWHLTPHGWLLGSQERDGVAIPQEPPADRVMTCEHHEIIGQHSWAELKWQTDNSAAIRRLAQEHGPYPIHPVHVECATGSRQDALSASETHRVVVAAMPGSLGGGSAHPTLYSPKPRTRGLIF